MSVVNKKIALVVALSLLIGTVNGYLIHELSLINFKPSPSVSANVHLILQNEFGAYDIPTHNLITDRGEQYVRNILGFNNETNNNATKWISLSWDPNPSASWTKLPNETLRIEGTVVAWVYNDDYAYNVTGIFHFNETTTLQCVGLQWSGEPNSDNNLFACAAFPLTTFQENWNLTITWSIVWNAN